MKKAVFLAFTAFVGLVAFINGAPAASRADIARTTKVANVQRVTNANTIARPGSTNAAARTSTTNARRAAKTNATSRTSATGRAETVSRATVAPTVSRAATANSASRAITRASSGATSRGGVAKSTLGRAVELHGVVDGDSNDTDVIAVVVDQSIIDAYENIRTYLSLRGKNNKKLFFKTVNTPNQYGSVNDLPSLATLFSKIQAGNSITIDGIYNTLPAQPDHQYIDSTGASVVGKDSKFDSEETYYLLPASAQGGAGGEIEVTPEGVCPSDLQTVLANKGLANATCPKCINVVCIVSPDSNSACTAYYFDHEKNNWSVCPAGAAVSCNLSTQYELAKACYGQ